MDLPTPISSGPGLSRLPRFTPQRTAVSTSAGSACGPSTSTSQPEFKAPKHRSVQALSLQIKKRYSSGRRVPTTSRSPAASRAALVKKTNSAAVKRSAALPPSEVAVKKPRILTESNRLPARRPVASVENSKAKKPLSNVRSRLNSQTVSEEEAGGPSGVKKEAGDKRPGKLQPWDTKGKLERLQEVNKKLKGDLESYREINQKLEAHALEADEIITNLRAELEKEKLTSSLLKEENGKKSEDIMRLESKIASLLSDIEKYKEESGAQKAEIVSLQKRCEDQTNEIGRLHETRKLLHNMVQDLKGNIRVLCRVRPPTEKERSLNCQLCEINYHEDTSLEIYKSKDGTSKNKVNATFSFDRVFPTSSRQADVFAELEQLVQSSLDGYNVCVFAYGQTGSGKTFTMDGLSDTDELRGMIPRTVDTVFSKIEELKLAGWEYTVQVFFLEIYNEQIRDLLNYNSDMSYDIRMVQNRKNEVYVTNLQVKTVKNEAELNRYLSVARNNRFVASTVCNTYSSRSHFVMKIIVNGENKKREMHSTGSINLIDLAGSEKYEDNNAADRRKETMNINKSLSSLANVILSLQLKNDHVPYRVSKLTHLLMPCLGGSAKTLMIVNISPLKDCFPESLNSLRFASRVNQCHLVAKKNVKTVAVT